MDRRSFLKMALGIPVIPVMALVSEKPAGIRMTEPSQVVSGVSIAGDLIIESGAHNAIVTNSTFVAVPL